MYQSNDFCFLCHRLSLLINFLIYIYIYICNIVTLSLFVNINLQIVEFIL